MPHIHIPQFNISVIICRKSLPTNNHCKWWQRTSRLRSVDFNFQQRQHRKRRFVSWLKRFRIRPLRFSSTGSGSVLRPPAGSTRLTGLWGNFRTSRMPWTNWSSAILRWRMKTATVRNAAWSTVCWRTRKILWVQITVFVNNKAPLAHTINQMN